MAVKGIFATAALFVIFTAVPAQGASDATEQLKSLMSGLEVLRRLMDYTILEVPEDVKRNRDEKEDYLNNLASLAGIHEYLPRFEDATDSENVNAAGESLDSAACEWLKTSLNYSSENFDCHVEMTKLGKEIAVRNTTRTVYNNLRTYIQIHCEGDEQSCYSLPGDQQWLNVALNATECITGDVFEVLTRVYDVSEDTICE